MQSEVVSSRAYAQAQLAQARAAACELQLLREEATRVAGLTGPQGPTAAHVRRSALIATRGLLGTGGPTAMHVLRRVLVATDG
eukprot:1136861-Pelagomonas_calceolata.AAC.12